MSPLIFGGLGVSASDYKAGWCSLKLESLNLKFGPEMARVSEHIQTLKAQIKYPKVPDVEELSILVSLPETNAPGSKKVSAGVNDPILERIREINAVDDFKPLSDVQPKILSKAERALIEKRAREASQKIGGGIEGERIYLKTILEQAYDHTPDMEPVHGMAPARWRVNSKVEKIDRAFAYAESRWDTLLRKPRDGHSDSLLPSKFATLVPGGRFSESYNWDTLMAVEGAIATGRIEVAQMQVENLLSYVRQFGFVPNGARDYYLTRSQPPVLSTMVRQVYEASIKAAGNDLGEKARINKWLKERALPLIEGEYKEFFMNPKTRYDPKTGLNHHWDEANIPRPERHGADDELAIGKTYRDTRAAAESGLDFTMLHQGEATNIAPVLLNSVMGKVEKDLSWMHEVAGHLKESKHFERAFENRQSSMNKYLWNNEKGRYENYNLRTQKRVDALGADTYTPMWAGLASKTQAERTLEAAKVLEKDGGIAASDIMDSHHQWDGNNGWAPFQYFAINGMRNYGYVNDAKRVANKWVNGLADSFAKEGSMYERIDVETLSKPVEDGEKYDPQPDFLWSIATYEWALIDVLGYKPIAKD